MAKSVCVDMDGVLADYRGWLGTDHIGDPRPGARDFMVWLSKIARVIVYTTRCKADDPELGRRPEETPEVLAGKVERWLRANDIPFDEVYIGQGKPIACAYVDDRAVAVPTNPEENDFPSIRMSVHRLIHH